MVSFSGHAAYATSPTGDWLIPILLLGALIFGSIVVVYFSGVLSDIKRFNASSQDIIVKAHIYYSAFLAGTICALIFWGILRAYLPNNKLHIFLTTVIYLFALIISGCVSRYVFVSLKNQFRK